MLWFSYPDSPIACYLLPRSFFLPFWVLFMEFRYTPCSPLYGLYSPFPGYTAQKSPPVPWPATLSSTQTTWSTSSCAWTCLPDRRYYLLKQVAFIWAAHTANLVHSLRPACNIIFRRILNTKTWHSSKEIVFSAVINSKDWSELW